VVAVHVELFDGVHWIAECSDIGDTHMHTAVYLIETDEGTILIDTGSHTHQAPLQQAIEATVGDGGVDAIVISHPDLPHSGNVRHFQEVWDDPEIVSSVATPPVVGLPDRTRATIGSETEVLGRRITFADPPLADIVFSTWPYDHETGVLFSIDGFGTYHEPGACQTVINDESDLPSVEEIGRYHADTFRWLEFVDAEKFERTLRETFEAFDVSYVAPTHGSPIAAECIGAYLDRLTEAVVDVSRSAP
jgi:flavorubredoxin